jgi:integrase
MPRTPSNGQNIKSDFVAAAYGVANGHERTKDFLSETEIAALLDSAKTGRHGVRDHLLLLVMFRHGLRVSEAVAVRRDEVDLDRARLWVRRLKGGLSVEHRSLAMNYALSDVTSPFARIRYPGCSSPNVASRSPGNQ